VPEGTLRREPDYPDKGNYGNNKKKSGSERSIGGMGLVTNIDKK